MPDTFSGLHPGCLRFAAAVTQTPRKTRFRLVANLGRTGFDPQDLFGKFPSDSSHVVSSPFPELARRTPPFAFFTLLRRGGTLP